MYAESTIEKVDDMPNVVNASEKSIHVFITISNITTPTTSTPAPRECNVFEMSLP